MFEDVSRRTFLKGTAATAALAAAGSLSLGAWRDQAQAAEAGGMSGEVRQAPSLCNGCSSKCGLVATTVGGKLYTLKGNETHPYSKGRICGRGHG
ncbi:MAG: twin-arginine translocation signal domain-containing protein, partial [Eggerthellaceae bacterium]